MAKVLIDPGHAPGNVLAIVHLHGAEGERIATAERDLG